MLRRAGGEKVKGTATFWWLTLQILHDAQVFFVSARSRYNKLEKQRLEHYQMPHVSN
jgi:hypothetical protein